jgi:hypothetical protein
MATIYIEQFDQSQVLDTLGRVDYRADYTAPETDVKLRTLVDIDVIRQAFRFKSDSTDFDEESATAQYVTGKNIIPYDTNDVNTHYVYYKENDHTNGIAASVDFVQQLARVVFGSVSAVDLFSNEDDVADAYKEAIITCGKKVKEIPSGSLQLDDDQITNDEAAVAGVFVDNIVHDSNSAALGVVGGSGAEFSLTTNGGGNVNLTVTDAGSGYSANDVLTLTHANLTGNVVIKVTNVTTGGAISTTETVSGGGGHTVNQSAFSVAHVPGGAGLQLEVTVDTAATPKFTNVKVLKPGSGYVSGEVVTMTDGANSATKIDVTLSDASLYYVNGNMKDRATLANTTTTGGGKIPDGTYIVTEPTTKTVFEVVIESYALAYLLVKTKGTNAFVKDYSGTYELVGTLFVNENTTIVPNAANKITLVDDNFTTDDLAILNQLNNVGKHSVGGKAAQDVLSGLLAQKPERFEFTSCCSLGSGISANDGTNLNVTGIGVTGGNDQTGAGATFDVIIHDGVLKSVSVNTRATTDYVVGNVLTVTVAIGKTITITLDDVFLNYVNAFDSALFSAMPIYADDKLQMIFHISSHPGQVDASGDPVHISRSALIELHVKQENTSLTTPS